MLGDGRYLSNSVISENCIKTPENCLVQVVSPRTQLGNLQHYSRSNRPIWSGIGCYSPEEFHPLSLLSEVPRGKTMMMMMMMMMDYTDGNSQQFVGDDVDSVAQFVAKTLKRLQNRVLGTVLHAAHPP